MFRLEVVGSGRAPYLMGLKASKLIFLITKDIQKISSMENTT